MNAVGGTCQLWFLAEPGLIAAICRFRLDLRKVSAMPGTWQASKIAGNPANDERNLPSVAEASHNSGMLAGGCY